jgi:AhpD family alkylhydroperoxidase
MPNFVLSIMTKDLKTTTMESFNVPTREEVSENNQIIFDKLQKGLGFVPNLYATIAHSNTALENYLEFQSSKTSLSNKEKEAVNLIVSQVNNCKYCQSAHTLLGKMNGFNEEQIIELRSGFASFDTKLDALVKLAKEITETKGQPSTVVLEKFFAAGYTKGSLIDVILAVADKVVMNYVHNITQVPIDFPLAAELDTVSAY